MVFSGKPAWRDGGEQGGIAKVAAGRVAGGESATSHADAAIVAERAKLAANDVARLLDTPVPPMPFRAMQIRHDDTLDFTRRIQSALTSAEVCEELLV